MSLALFLAMGILPILDYSNREAPAYMKEPTGGKSRDALFEAKRGDKNSLVACLSAWCARNWFCDSYLSRLSPNETEAGLKPRQKQEPTPQISLFLLHYEERADRQGVYAGAVEAADGGAWVGDEGFAEKVEAGIDENGGGSGFAKFVKQLPEKRIGLFFDSVNADSRAVEGEAFKTSDGIFQIA